MERRLNLGIVSPGRFCKSIEFESAKLFLPDAHETENQSSAVGFLVDFNLSSCVVHVLNLLSVSKHGGADV